MVGEGVTVTMETCVEAQSFQLTAEIEIERDVIINWNQQHRDWILHYM